MKTLLNKVYSGENLKILKKGIQAKGLSALWAMFRTKWNQIAEPERTDQWPIILHIETTSRCNLRCPSCAHSELGGKGEDMTLEKFKSFLDQFDYVAKVILYGIGETLMHRDIFEMVKYAKKRNIFCGFFTNGTLLTEKAREQILEHGQDYLNISIDGATKESFEKQRAGANFEKVKANVRAMTDLVKERKSPLEMAVWNCLTEENIHELPDLVRLTHEVGIKKLVLQDIMFWNSDGIEKNFEDKILDSKETTRSRYFQEGSKIAKELGITLDLLMSAADGKRRCKVPWYFSYITAKGLATPCNWHGWDGEKLNFGSVFERPFHEIWNDEKYIQFRKEMKEPKEPDFCKKCPMYDREMIHLA